MAGPTSADQLIRRVAVETPEQVTILLELAGLGSRLLAHLVDLIILGVLLTTASATLNYLAPFSGIPGIVAAVKIAVVSGLGFGYFILPEVLQRGQTPGKRLLGIRVVADTGHRVSWGQSITRNLLRLADSLPPPAYIVGGLLVALHPRGQRLGDLVAGTLVIRDRPQQPSELEQRSAEATPARLTLEQPRLLHEEFQLLNQFIERLPSLDSSVAQRLAVSLASRFASRAPVRPSDPLEFLTELHRGEIERQRAGVGRTEASGGPGTNAAKFVARQEGRWREFHRLARRAADRGLDTFAPDELLAFAARYREVAADLARARTYGVAAPVVSRLERLAAAGHNALYRRRPKVGRLWDIFFRRCPAAVIHSAGYVAVSFAAFMVPGVAGYRMIRQDPALAEIALNEVMLERAAEGVARAESGERYFEAAAGDRPAIASYIVTNNIRVAAACFAGGALLGVGSLLLLGLNGLSLGAAAGHFANVGLLGYLGEFVVGHGVLELFAIWVAGAAGLRLGLALIAPGRRTRGDALVAEGGVALRLVGAASVMLLLAGLIEGFLSAGGQAGSYRAAVSMSTLVFLALYLANGYRARHGSG